MQSEDFVRAPEFSKIYSSHFDSVHRRLLRLGVHERDVPDVAQEVFAIVHRKFGTFAGYSSFSTWLYGICRKVAGDYRQRASVRHEDLSAAPREFDPSPPLDEHVARWHTQLAVRRAVARLPHHERSIVSLYHLEERPMAAAARECECPVQTAYARLYRAHRRLSTLLQSEEEC